jgi:CheB methylesterase
MSTKKKHAKGGTERRVRRKPKTPLIQPVPTQSFRVVGVGASAGGLEAFRRLLDHLPNDTGMAFVLVQHLDPTRESVLAELLSKATDMPVKEVKDGMRVDPNCVYVIPPNTNMSIAKGALRLAPREDARGQHHPIDYFMRSLAEEKRSRAIGVILWVFRLIMTSRRLLRQGSGFLQGPLRTLRLCAFARTGGRVGEFLAKAQRRKVRKDSSQRGAVTISINVHRHFKLF